MMPLTFDYVQAASTSLRNDPQGREIDKMWYEVKGYPPRDPKDVHYPENWNGSRAEER